MIIPAIIVFLLMALSSLLLHKVCNLEEENHQLRARLAALEAPPDYLKGENE